MDFSQLVKKVRQTLDISQEDLARFLGVSFATINRWENGRTVPNRLSQECFYAFCKKQGIDDAILVNLRRHIMQIK